MEVRARISRHPLFPLVTEMTVFRHRASVAVSLPEMQRILASINESVEKHFTDLGGDNSPTNSNPMVMLHMDSLTDTQIDHLVRSSIVILISHVLEFHEHVAAMEEAFEGLVEQAATEFNQLMGGLSIMASVNQEFQSPSFKRTADEDLSHSIGVDKKKAKRTNHKPEITELLKNWVMKHEAHPYPDEEQKKLLCELTKLSREQLDHWFINARRRFLRGTKDSVPRDSTVRSTRASRPGSSAATSSANSGAEESPQARTFTRKGKHKGQKHAENDQENER